MSSAVSNKFGFYRIKLSINDLPIRLTISKADYEKQDMVIKSARTNYEIIELNPILKQTIFMFSIEDNSIEQMDSLRNIPYEIKTKETPTPPQFPDISDENLFPTSPILDSTLYESRWDKFKKS